MVLNEPNLRDVIRPGSSLGLDFVKEEELNKRTGIDASAVIPFVVSEKSANSLDKDATKIIIDVQRDSTYDIVAVSDNGSRKFTRSDLKLILDFENKASSKRGFVRVSRGCLGNFLKCGWGYSYELAEKRGLPQYPITVASGKFEYKIILKPDKVRERIDYDLETKPRTDDGFTTVKVGFPIEGSIDAVKAVLKKLVFAMHMVNPGRLITYNLYGDKGTLGEAQENKVVEHETVITWYTPKQRTELFEDFVRTVPEAQAKDFIGLFKWFGRKSAQRDVCLEVNMTMGTNCMAHVDSKSIGTLQIVPATPLKDFSSQARESLFDVMLGRSKPIHKRSIPSFLGCVGKDNFERISQQHGWTKPRYVCLAGTNIKCSESLHFPFSECKNPDHVEIPYLIELVVYDRGDSEGLEVYEAVNFMSSMHDLFASTFDVKYRLGKVGLSQSSSVTIVVHLVTPMQPWMNYGKTNIGGKIDPCRLMEQAFDKLLPIPKTPREYHPPPPARPLSWVPRGDFYDVASYRQRLKLFAQEILMIDRKSSFHKRPRMRGWGYRLEELHYISDKGEFPALARAINDCRKLGYLPMDIISEDPDESRHFKFHRAISAKGTLQQFRTSMTEMLGSLPSVVTDFYKGEKYYVMMVVEKGEILQLFGPICDEYGYISHAASKGWPNLELLNNIASQCKWAVAHGLKPVLLLFYDMDPKGEEIPDTFRKLLRQMQAATGWNPDNMEIVRFGLTEEQIEEHKLSWVNNLKTSSGKEAKRTRKVLAYIERHKGPRKCEMESLYKDEKTVKAGEQLCREAIEGYLGKGSVERFQKKVEESEAKLAVLYDNPIWKQFDAELSKVSESLPEEPKITLEAESPESLDALVDDKNYGQCPECGTEFNDLKVGPGTLVRCRFCNASMRVILVPLKDRLEMLSLFKLHSVSIKEIAARYKITEKNVSDILTKLMENEEEESPSEIVEEEPLVGTDEEYAAHVRKTLEQQLEQQEEVTETQVEILRLFLHGKATLKQFAAEYGVTEEQATQILAEMKLSPDSEKDASTNHA